MALFTRPTLSTLEAWASFDAATGNEYRSHAIPADFVGTRRLRTVRSMPVPVDFPLVAVDSQTRQVKWVYMDHNPDGINQPRRQ